MFLGGRCFHLPQSPSNRCPPVGAGDEGGLSKMTHVVRNDELGGVQGLGDERGLSKVTYVVRNDESEVFGGKEEVYFWK
ncbi:hypothetical protein CEXT_492881 [Caerostris extrusa]|uniref:Uncharacterized protein n=1 Tax=Caerostris extrusa TaxID=172846 RepID=A0AAV4WEL0_CAEEX|nr:hypothetical protein CEXT_492881 [Caerostris extrusa]